MPRRFSRVRMRTEVQFYPEPVGRGEYSPGSFIHLKDRNLNSEGNRSPFRLRSLKRQSTSLRITCWPDISVAEGRASACPCPEPIPEHAVP